jgi:hypothetical protein
MDPLRRLIDAVLAACPDADIDYGPALATGTPTVRLSRTPGIPQPSFWVIFHDTPGKYVFNSSECVGKVGGSAYCELGEVVSEACAFLRTPLEDFR